jgi:hypothetical protein
MKKNIIGSLLLPGLLAGTPAGADTTCICIDVANTKMCGAGGTGACFLKVHKDVSSSILDRFLVTPAYKAEFNDAGQSYDTNTGWFCLNSKGRAS